MELNSLTDDILIKVFVYLDFKTRHNGIPLVCRRWAQLVRSNELWREVLVLPRDEATTIGVATISQSRVFRWCSQTHVRPFVESLKLIGLGAGHDDFSPVGLGALFGICCSAMRRLYLHASRALLNDFTSLLCLFRLEGLSLSCIDPDPLNPYDTTDIQCIAALSQLCILDFDLNIVQVPVEFSQLQKLKSFSVTGTGIASLMIPFQLSALCQLEELVVRNPLWAEVHDVVYRFPKLRSLEVRGHPYFSHSISFCSEASKMHQLERLGVVAHQLLKTPEHVGDMIFLKTLDLSWNNFDQRMPDDVVFPFMRLCRLKSLDISYCALRRLPSSLQYLTHLVELNLSGNAFESLSPVLTHCLNLTRLKMRSCALQIVPEVISEIANLEHLDISNNPITSVDGLSPLLKKERFVALIFHQDLWNPELDEKPLGIAKRILEVYRSFNQRASSYLTRSLSLRQILNVLYC